MEKLKLFFHNYRNWIYNLQYMFISVPLLIFVCLVDVGILPIKESLPDVLLIRTELTRTILTGLAATFLTIATFTFSTILSVMSAYASNFTPRVIENFIDKKIPMKVLGIYLGGFFYSLTTLFITSDYPAEAKMLSGTVALFYAVFTVSYFIRFVQMVLSKFQPTPLIFEVSSEAAEVIAEEVKNRRAAQRPPLLREEPSFCLYAEEAGYLSLIAFAELADLLHSHEGLFSVQVQIGEYVLPHSLLAAFYGDEEGFDEELSLRLRECFILQDRKVAALDYRYNLDKLTEIGIRALSPGINDPGTANHCINKIAGLMISLAETDSHYIQKTGSERCQLFYTSFSFEEDLERFLLPFVTYGHADMSVVSTLLKVLRGLLATATFRHRQEIQKIARHVVQKAAASCQTDYEKALLKELYQDFREED